MDDRRLRRLALRCADERRGQRKNRRGFFETARYDDIVELHVLTTFIVVIRIFANPIANVFQKRLTQRSASPVMVISATHALMALLVLPFAVRAPWTDLGAAFWGNMAVCAILAVAGNMLLVAALRSTDLSVLGPINSYKAVVSLVAGVFLLGEVPTRLGAVGILLTVIGSVFVVDRGAPGQARGIQLRVGALVCSATEAVFLKRAILLSSPLMAFYGWVLLCLPLAALVSMIVLRRDVWSQMSEIPRQRLTYLWLAIATAVMQLTTLFALGSLQVGYALALFQLSTIVSVALGAHFFAEQNIRRRLAGSVVMMFGAILIVIAGRR